MGGYGSGRTKRHLTTSECIQIDMKDCKKALSKPGRDIYTLTAKGLPEKRYKGSKATLGIILERYKELQDDHAGLLTLVYQTSTTGGSSPAARDRKHDIEIPLVTTPCNYGGQRWWMLAPCCGARVRVVYLSYLKPMPYCRVCQNLHYQSQMASYVEHHIAREKYLLANYGYQWAEWEYTAMKEHYFTITPEYEAKKHRSQMEMELKMITLLIRTERWIIKTRMRQFLSLKTEEDRQAFLQFHKERGQDLALVQLLKASVDLERVARSANIEGEIMNQIIEDHPQIEQWQARKKYVEEELNALEQAA